MKQKAKIGDIVETCRLMPAIIIRKFYKIFQDFYLHFKNEDYDGKLFSQCSITHCGIVLLSPEQALKRLNLGEERLTELWNQSVNVEEYYQKLGEEIIIYAE